MSRLAARAWRQESGSTSVEYAAVLMLVVGLSFMAYSVFTARGTHSLGRLAASMPDAGGTASGTGEWADSRSVANSGEPATQAADAGDAAGPSFWPQMLAVSGTLLAAVALVANRRRVKGRRRGANGAASAETQPSPQALHQGFAEKRQQILKMLTGHARRHPGQCVTARHLMTTRLTTVAPAAPLAEVERLMQTTRVRHLLVVQGEKLVGLISDRDLFQRDGRTAADVMTRQVVTVTSDTPAAQAISAMLTGRFSCVPVVDAGRLVGLLTSSDLIMALQCTLQLLTQSAEWSQSESEVRGALRFSQMELDELQAYEPVA